MNQQGPQNGEALDPNPPDSAPARPGLRERQVRSLTLALVINTVVILFLGLIALVSNSLVVGAAAIHQLVDAAAIIVTISVIKLSNRPPSARHTFGLARLEVLGALANGVILAVITVAIALAAVFRLTSHSVVHPLAITLAGVIGAAASLASLIALRGTSGSSLSVRSTVMHFYSDAVTWGVTILSGTLIYITQIAIFDPLGTIAISAIILVATWRLVVQTLDVLLEASPQGIDAEQIEEAILGQEKVVGAHHLHLWSLSSDVPALSAHVVFEDVENLHEAQLRADSMKHMLSARFKISHVTLEIECHPCAFEDHDVTPSTFTDIHKHS